MRGAIELANIHDVALILQNSGFVVVHVKVIRGREDGHDRREASRLSLAIHAIAAGNISGTLAVTGASNTPCILGLVRADDRQKIIALQKLARGLVP